MVAPRGRSTVVALAPACGALVLALLAAACGAARRPVPSARGIDAPQGALRAGAALGRGVRPARRPLDAELLAVGQGFACARAVDRRVRCWGSNVAGQLGDGTTTVRDGPVLVAGLSAAEELAAGAGHACAVVAGAVYCWGDNEHGQLGDGTLEPHERPAPVPALRGGAAQLALGRAHSCAALEDGTVRCWGENLNGALGNGGSDVQTEPVAVAGLSGVVRVAAGFEHTCALRADGAVYCWGDNVFGQLGAVDLARARTPQRVGGLPPARDIAVAADQSCAVLAADGAVRCWGLRHRDREPVYRADDPRAALADVRDAAQLATGVLLSCVLRVDRTVRCWGWFDLEDSRSSDGAEVRADTAPVLRSGAHRYAWYDGAVPGVRDATRVAVGDDHACALLASGDVVCWGANEFGQLGGARPAVSRPRLVTPAVRDVVEVALGAAHSCARTRGGEVRCWGRNAFGELGRMTRTRTSPAPAAVAGLLGAGAVAQLALGGGVSCARMDDGAVSCWGGDGGAWLGDGRPTRIDAAASAVPVAVRDVSQAAQLAVGAERACARLTDGRVRCWGGHLPRAASPPAAGNDVRNTAAGATTGSPLVAATDIPGVLDAQQVTVGAAHACVRYADGTAQCLGRNDRGQLGDGTRRAAPLPVPVAGLANATELVARGDHTCALGADGAVTCWGANDRGQLGDGTSEDRATPTAVTGLSAGVAQVALGEAHACARMTDGTVRCWGANDAGQLGLEGPAAATVAWREVPAQVPGLDRVVGLALGRDHGCALRADGTLRCWGANDNDQLGDDRPPASAIPVRVRWR